jgi:hypothetical protein
MHTRVYLCLASKTTVHINSSDISTCRYNCGRSRVVFQWATAQKRCRQQPFVPPRTRPRQPRHVHRLISDIFAMTWRSGHRRAGLGQLRGNLLFTQRPGHRRAQVGQRGHVRDGADMSAKLFVSSVALGAFYFIALRCALYVANLCCHFFYYTSKHCAPVTGAL